MATNLLRNTSPSVFLFILLASLSLMWSCRSDLENPEWNAEYLVPLIADDLQLGDIVPDSLLEVDPDSLLHIVYRNELYSLNLVDQQIDVPDTSLSVFVSLDSLRLDDREIQVRLSLGQILLEVPGGPLLIGLIAAGFPVAIPEIVDFTTGTVPVDATDFFQTATIDSGYLDITVENGLPVDLTDAVFRLSDPMAGVDIILDTFDLIPSGGSVMATADLADQTLGGLLEAELIKVSTPGTATEIVVDTSDAVLITASVRDLKVSEATAIFPAQDLVTIRSDIVYNLGGPRVTWMAISSGDVVVDVVNTIQDSMFIEYRIPGAVGPDGSSVDFQTVVPPAPPGGTISVSERFDLTGFEVDLTGSSGNAFNQFYNEFDARIDSTGNLVSISLEDSLEVIYGLENVVPEAMRGYLGQYEFDIDQETPFDFLSSITGGSLDLEMLSVDMSVTNGVGAEGEVLVQELRATNSRTGAEVVLDAPSLIGTPIDIERALDNPFVAGFTNVGLNETNSNIDELVEAFPDALALEAEVNINPNGNTFNYQDFVSSTSELDVALDLDIPMSFKAESVSLRDTLDFELFSDASNPTLVVESGKLVFHAENGFPLDAELQIEFLDFTESVVHTLFVSPQSLTAGVVGADCRVSSPGIIDLEVELSESDVEALRGAYYAVLVASFSTPDAPSCGDYVKLYSDYSIIFNLSSSLDIRVIADF